MEVNLTGLDVPSLSRTFQTASEEMLAAVLDQSVDCIKVIGPAGTLDFMNRNGRCAMEIDDFALVAGKYWWELWPEESAALVRDAVERARAGEASRFEAFCPTAKGNPRWWEVSVSPLRDRDGALQGLVSVSRDISDRVSGRVVREAAAAEMRHRLQNAYTLAGAIVSTTARGDPDREAFAAEVLSRLQRLGAAQSLLLDPNLHGRPTLALLLQRLTEPFVGASGTLTIGALPELELGEDQVRTLALAIGEFSTNSNKYGALGHGGTIAIEGALTGGTLRLGWSEVSDVPVTAHEREGSAGFSLIRRTLSAQGGTLDIDWHDKGLDIGIIFPLRAGS